MAISKLPTSASLKEVMDKFEEISVQDFSSIDIITANELPVDGKENRICIITDIEPKNIFVKYSDDTVSTEETSITMQLSATTKSVTQHIISSNKTLVLSYSYTTQYIGGRQKSLDSYIYKNGAWVLLTQGAKYAFLDGAFLNNDYFGSFSMYSSSSNATGENTFKIIDSNILQLITTKSSGSALFRFSKKIDCTNLRKIVVDVNEFNVNLSGNYCSLQIGINDGSKFIKIYSRNSSSSSTMVEIDLTDITGSYYITFRVSTDTGVQGKGTYMKIRSIYVE